MKKNILKDHVCTCKERNEREGKKDIYFCFLCQKPPKKSKYPYWSQYQIYREKCHAHDGMLDTEGYYELEKEIFEKFITENIKYKGRN